eukprot:1195750-Prorocentrum_minimum.AAC.2
MGKMDQSTAGTAAQADGCEQVNTGAVSGVSCCQVWCTLDVGSLQYMLPGRVNAFDLLAPHCAPLSARRLVP